MLSNALYFVEGRKRYVCMYQEQEKNEYDILWRLVFLQSFRTAPRRVLIVA